MWTIFGTNSFFFEKPSISILLSILKDCFFRKGFYREEFFPKNLKEFVIENSKFGIKILNTISDFDIENGATHLIPYSHKPEFPELGATRESQKKIQNDPTQIQAVMKAGSI